MLKTSYSNLHLTETLNDQLVSVIKIGLSQNYDLSNEKIERIVDNCDLFTLEEFQDFYCSENVQWVMNKYFAKIDEYDCEKTYVAYYLNGTEQYALYLVKIVYGGLDCYGFGKYQVA